LPISRCTAIAESVIHHYGRAAFLSAGSPLVRWIGRAKLAVASSNTQREAWTFAVTGARSLG
jgi:hypothetical protein